MASSSTSAELVYEYQPTTPAGTAEASPYVVAIPLPGYEVQFIEWKVPPGPQGNLGWRLLYSKALVIPQNGTWIITDNEAGRWELDKLPVSGDWYFQSYNTGSYPHTVYIRFLLNPLADTSDDDLGLIVPASIPSADIPLTSNVFELF
jgi:hypothetical protein